MSEVRFSYMLMNLFAEGFFDDFVDLWTLVATIDLSGEV